MGKRTAAATADAAPEHNREKQRLLTLDRPFLAELGVTDAQQRLVPAMARKWKQINKFLEVIGAALAASPLATQQHIEVLDFGSGKGYLTFALHDHLRHALGLRCAGHRRRAARTTWWRCATASSSGSACRACASSRAT